MTNDKKPAPEKVVPLKPANDPKPQPKSEAVLNLPPMTQALCLAMLGIETLLQMMQEAEQTDAFMFFGVVPARYIGDLPFDMGAVIAPVTHMFLHSGWLHAGMNVATLMAFGAVLEKIMGARKMLTLFLASGIVGAVVHFFALPESQLPLIGASGAISGLFGAVLVMMRHGGGVKRSYRVLLPFVLIWVGISVFFGLFGMPGVEGNVAWTTHIGGFVTGLVLAFRFKI